MAECIAVANEGNATKLYLQFHVYYYCFTCCGYAPAHLRAGYGVSHRTYSETQLCSDVAGRPSLPSHTEQAVFQICYTPFE
jgi:hypothetical protein